MSKIIDIIHSTKSDTFNEVKQAIIDGADVNETNHKDFTPFMVAVYNGKLDVAELLLQNNADPWYENYAGYSAFILWVNEFVENEYWYEMEEMFYLMCKYYIYKNEYAPHNLFRLIFNYGWPEATRHMGGSLFEEDKSVAL